MSLSYTEAKPKSDLLVPIYESSFGNSSGNDASHFWDKPKLYAEEHRLFSYVPTMRFVNTLLVIYALYVGIDVTVGLCTSGMEFMCGVALVFCMLYWFWATWWDEAYAYPVNWTYLKQLGVHPVLIIFLICPFALMVGWAFFLAAAMFLFSFMQDFRDVFKWEC